MKEIYSNRFSRKMHVDDRGEIDNILDNIPILSVARITIAEGTIRGNHYHLEDEHYCYIESGYIKYEYETEDGEKGEIFLEHGDVVYTPKMEKHKFTAIKSGVFWAFAIKSRTEQNYESDLIRL